MGARTAHWIGTDARGGSGGARSGYSLVCRLIPGSERVIVCVCVCRIMLTVFAANEGAVRFYTERLGCVIVIRCCNDVDMTASTLNVLGIRRTCRVPVAMAMSRRCTRF